MHPGPLNSYFARPDWRSRSTSFLLAIATTVLIALLMLSMGVLGPGEKTNISHLVAVQIAPETQKHGERTHTVAKPKSAPKQLVVQPTPPRTPVIKPPLPVTPFVTMSKQEYAATDISRLGKSSPASGAGGTGSASSYGPGDGPGGVHLFNAEWYREPTDAELAPYLGHTNGTDAGDWAMIACKTIDHYHVENCQELDESPPGSGLARALRQAAWQFLVRPPRVDGNVMVGSWVRIKFTFTGRKREEPAESVPGADQGN